MKKIFGSLFITSSVLLSSEEQAPVKIPEFWQTIIPSPHVETLYLRLALQPRRTAIFRDLGMIPMQQSPYHGYWKIDSSSTSWSSDCQIYEFFQQSRIALQTLDFNF